MNRKKLVLSLVVVAAMLIGFAVSSTGVYAAKAAVPDCDCTIHNWPNPGDTVPGKRTNGECFATPCATEIE